MIGDGPDREAAVAEARELKVCSYVKFLGKQDGIEKYLGGADLFLMPSDHESFGLAALEALSCETPVVGSRAGGLPEVVEDGVTGALEEVGRVEAMAQRAVEILRDSKLQAEMGRTGRRHAIERFSVEKKVLEYEALYERAIGDCRNRYRKALS